MRASRRSVWLIGAGVWATLAVLTALQNYVFRKHIDQDIDLWTALWRELLMFGAWALLTPPIVWFTHRVQRATRPWRARLLHIPAGIACAVVHVLLLLWVWSAIEGIRRSVLEEVAIALLNSLVLELIMYAAIVGVVEAVRATRLSSDLARARLDALNGQLQPHFLFNTLHAASSLIDTDATAARSTIVRLSDLLRATLDIKTTVVSLDDELALLDRYLDIQRVRFHDRLTVTVEVPDYLRGARVPPLVLQPLVENAIRHGIGTRPEAGAIVVRATRAEGRIAIVVEDDGIGLAADHAERIGVGTTRARLAVLHGDVRLEPRPGGGTRAIVELPFTTS